MATFHDPLLRALQVAGARTALVHEDRSWTYREFYDRCRRLAGALYELDGLGLEAGDRVAILAGNCNQYIETYVGTPAAGLVVVPLNTRHAEPELRYALEDSGAKILITDRDAGALRDVVARVINLDEYEQLLADAQPRPLGQGIYEDTLAGLFYTGGTTGKSKGVMLSHGNLLANTTNWLLCCPQTGEDRTLIVAPLFHAAGSNGVLGAIALGATQVTLGAFDPEATLDLIERYGITLWLGVPTMLSAVAELQHVSPRDVASVRLIAHGGSPIAN